MSSEKITDSVHSISGKSIQEPAVAKSTAISTNSGSNKLESESENAQNASESETELHLVSSDTSTEYVKSRGVRRIENVKVMMSSAKNGKIITIAFCTCLLVIAWVLSLDGSTTSNYSVPATSSFSRHSMISTVNIATLIIGSVVQPFQAKFSDIN